MAEVKSAFEKAMERAEKMGKLTEDEKRDIRERQKVRDILSEYYKKKIDRDELWKRMNGLGISSLREAQLNMLSSIRLGSNQEEIRLRRDGILAIETLKGPQKTAILEDLLASIERLHAEYNQIREHAAEELREAIERNPQMRVRPMRMPDGRTVLQTTVSVDEAMEAHMAEYLKDHEERYEEMLERVKERLGLELTR
jgi:hypothetical protein